jgi:hypothetical protein
MCLSEILVETPASYRISIDGSAAIALRLVFIMADVILHDGFQASIHLLRWCLATVYVSRACTYFFRLADTETRTLDKAS